MRNDLHAFDRKETIAERLVQRAAELWGVDHPDHIDPIVKLMVDVIAFELARLGMEMSSSEGKLFETMAGILVPGSWLLPRPSHALMTAQPLEPRARLKTSDQFYIPIKDKAVTGEEAITDLFFSPLQAVDLIKSRVAFKVVGNTIYQATEADQYVRFPGAQAPRPGFNGLWLGLDLADGISSLDRLDMYVQLPDQALHLAPLLALASWRTSSDAQLSVAPYALRGALDEADEFDGRHFALRYPERTVFKGIAASYRYNLFTLGTGTEQPISITKRRFPVELEPDFSSAHLERFEKPLWWLKVELPAAFSMAVIEQVHFALNCFPVLAKRLHTTQHRLHQGGNIVPLRLPEHGSMFFVEAVCDDKGREFNQRQFKSTTSEAGTYRLYQGDLERLDKTTAASHLAKVVRLVQEESSLFTAFGQDLMMKQLNNLRNDLEAIRKQLGATAYAAMQDRDYLLVEPFPDTKSLEIEYWSAEQRSFRNFLRPGIPLLPYKQVTVQPGSARLKTMIVPGMTHPQGEEKIAALRYGLLARDRIVSKQDARLFVLHSLAGFITEVKVQNGVAVSSDPKQGLVRTVDLLLHPAPSITLTAEDWGRLLTSLEENLNHRSVHTAAYRLRLIVPEISLHSN